MKRFLNMRPPRVLFLLICLSAFAFWWPTWFGDRFDPFLATRPWLWPLIALAMLMIGWLLPLDEFRQVARRWPTVLGGTAVQYASMPLLAFGFARGLGLSSDAMIGVILVGCVPGAMASNVLTLLAGGNVSYSVSLTTSATLLSPLVVPLALTLALGGVEVDFPAFETMRDLACYVVAPVVLGHGIGRSVPSWRPWARPVGSVVANAVILWVIAVVVASNRENLPQIDSKVFVALVGVNLFGYLAGFSGASALRLPASSRRALTLEVGMQNAGLGTTIALHLFPERPAVAIPCALYTFGCMVTGTVLATWWGQSPLKSSLNTLAMESNKSTP